MHYLRAVLKALGIFDSSMQSFSIESTRYRPKPDLGGFLRFVRANACIPALFMVEDTLANLRTAKKMGMKTVWVSRERRVPRYVDLRIENLSACGASDAARLNSGDNGHTGERKNQILQTLAQMLENAAPRSPDGVARGAGGSVRSGAVPPFQRQGAMYEGLIEFIEQTLSPSSNQITTEEKSGTRQIEAIVGVLLGFAQKNRA